MKILPTLYKGITYRSRMEARWAVFFDFLKIRHEYESEGYELDGFTYLPDFWLPDHDFFVEIKPVSPTLDESAKAAALAEFTKKTVFVFCGNPRQPWERKHRGHYSESAYAFFSKSGADIQWWWCECTCCGKMDVQFNGRSGRMKCCRMGDKEYNQDSPMLNAAYEAARRASFWNPKEAS